MTNLKDIENVAKKFNDDINELNKELKRVASIKCRLKKQKGRKDYDAEMQKVLSYEQVLKEAKQLVNPTEKPVTSYEQSDVDKLDYDETVKALKSIQSKKTNSRWLTTEDGNNDEFRNAVRIETMLKKHRESIRPVDEQYIRKTDLQTVIDTIESSGNVSIERITEMLRSLL